MQETYRRDLHHNYLILQEEERGADSYRLRMLLDNAIPGFLSCSLRTIDGQRAFHYDITSRVSLKEFADRKPVNMSVLRLLLTALTEAAEQLREYLLPAEGILLDPGKVYLSPDGRQIRLCYYPGVFEKEQNDLKCFSEQLLSLLDYQDRPAVALAYRFYQMAQEAQITFEDLETLLHTEDAERETVQSFGRTEASRVRQKRSVGNLSEGIETPSEDQAELLREEMLSALFEEEEEIAPADSGRRKNGSSRKRQQRKNGKDRNLTDKKNRPVRRQGLLDEKKGSVRARGLSDEKKGSVRARDLADEKNDRTRYVREACCFWQQA